MHESPPEPGARRLASRILAGAGVVGAAVAALVIAVAPPALAAGNGYGPTTPTPGGTATGLPGSVVTATTIQPSGGKATAAIGASTISATVPAGTFSVPTQLVFTDASSVSVTPSSGAVLVTFGVGFYQNGTKVSGTFSPVTITVTNPAITSGSTVDFVVDGTLEAVSGASVSNGSVTFTISSDPTIEVTASTSTTSATVPAATTVSTGKPFLLEGAIAGILVLGGVFLVVRALRRRPA